MLLYEADNLFSACVCVSDMVLINAAKTGDSNWEYVTETEKRSADAKSAAKKLSDTDTSDPSAGIMNLMKNM